MTARVPPAATATVLSPKSCGAAKLAGLSTESVPPTATVAPALTCTFDPAVKFSAVPAKTVNVPDGNT